MTANLPSIKDYNKPAVLIIDDEVKICMLIKAFLDQTNLFRNVVVAESSSIGSMKLRNDDFDLVIVDFQLPDRTGVQFVQSVRKSIKYSNLKFLLISGYLDNRSMIEVVGAGIKHVLVKPFAKDDLIEKVAKILKLEI